jgi:hypothetical protein
VVRRARPFFRSSHEFNRVSLRISLKGFSSPAGSTRFLDTVRGGFRGKVPLYKQPANRLYYFLQLKFSLKFRLFINGLFWL